MPGSLRRPCSSCAAAIVDVNLVFETEGVEAARAERRKLLSQIDDYLLPRLRESGAPILVALVGSTGAGKSTLVNSIVGAQVSTTGIRRPTTNSPVLACHPDDVGWFAENVFLPTVPRVRQEGLARSGRDGLLVLAANEGMPKGVALLDTPGHRLGGAGAPRVRLPVPGRLRPVAVHDHGKPLCRCHGVGTAPARQGPGRSPGRRFVSCSSCRQP